MKMFKAVATIQTESAVHIEVAHDCAEGVILFGNQAMFIPRAKLAEVIGALQQAATEIVTTR
jgi:hypothetical protein